MASVITPECASDPRRPHPTSTSHSEPCRERDRRDEGHACENRIISIRTSRVENFAQLSVSDRGPGIPEDKLKEVFEPFFTSKAEGMGMGLSIARTIIEAHKGQISAKNRDHGGATFRIRLPLVS